MPFIFIGTVVTIIVNIIAIYSVYTLCKCSQKNKVDDNNHKKTKTDSRTNTNSDDNDDNTIELKRQILISKIENYSSQFKLWVADIPTLIIYIFLYKRSGEVDNTSVSAAITISYILGVIDIFYVLIGPLQLIRFMWDILSCKCEYIQYKLDTFCVRCCGWCSLLVSALILSTTLILYFSLGNPATLSIGNTCYGNITRSYSIPQGCDLKTIYYWSDIDLFYWDNIITDNVTYSKVSLKFSIEHDNLADTGYISIGDYALYIDGNYLDSFYSNIVCTTQLDIPPCSINEDKKTSNCFNGTKTRSQKIDVKSVELVLIGVNGYCYHALISCTSNLFTFHNASASICLDWCKWQ
eukprot:212247_1